MMKNNLIYKIWNLKDEKYVSVSKSKSAWATEGGAINKLKDLTKSTKGHSSIYPTKAEYSEDDLELHVCEIIIARRYAAHDVLSTKKEREAKAAKAKTDVDRLTTDICKTIPGLNFNQIIHMYDKELLAKDVQETLAYKINQLSQAKKTVSSLRYTTQQNKL